MSIERVGAYEMARAYVQSADPAKTDAAGAHRKATTPGNAASPTDQVSLSDEARALAAAHKAVEEAPDIRQEKVAAIKQRIEDGTYNVSPKVLARKILEHVAGQGT